jgi:hypothetical protein
MDDQWKKRLGSLKQGHHACLFYDDPTISRAITAEYIKAGLRNNEQCLYLADPDSVSALRRELEKEIDVERESKRGALLLTSGRGHLNQGRFDVTHMIQFLKKGVDQAVGGGFAGLRASGDVVWELGDDLDMEKLADYEINLDHFFFGKKLTGLCQYNCNVVRHDYLRNALMCHNAVVFEETVAIENPFRNRAPEAAPQSFNRMLAELK